MLVFLASWSDFEEYFSLKIYCNDGKFYAHHKGHNVCCGDYCYRERLSEEQALELMVESAEFEDVEI